MKRFHTIKLLFLIIIIIPFFFAACLRKKDVEIPERRIPPGKTRGVEQKPIFEDIENIGKIKEKDIKEKEIGRIVIGCMLPLSGSYKNIGERALNGIEFALYDFNRKHPESVHIRLIVKNTRGTTDLALTGIKELCQAGVSAIIGPMIAVDTQLQNAAESCETPIIFLSNKEKVLGNGQFLFRNFLTPKNQVQAIVSYAVSKLGIKRFAIIYPDEYYGKNFMNLFWDEVSKYNAHVTGVESYNIDTNDFTIPIKKLIIPLSKIDKAITKKTADFKVIPGFEAIFIPDAPAKAGLIIPQLIYYDIKNVYVFGTNLWHSQELIDIAGHYANGVVMPDGFFAEAEPVKIFSKNFEKIYGNKPEFIEAVSYDTATILLEVIKKVRENSLIDIRSGLKNIKEYEGVTRLTSFDNSGEAKKKVYLLRLGASGFKEIK